MRDERSVKRVLVTLLLSFAIFFASLPAFAQADSTKRDTATFHMTKSPLKAVLLSAVLPGAGQAYLDQMWKVPVIWGVGGAFVYGALIQNHRYSVMWDSVTNAQNRKTALDSAWANTYASAREFYRDDRDKWWIYVGLTYIANILDAYIAANLYDFDVSNPDGSIVAPIGTYYDPSRKEFGVTLHIKY